MRVRLFLCICCSVIMIYSSAFAATFEEFKVKSNDFFNSKIAPEAMRKLADDAITKDAKEDIEYLAYAHAVRSAVYWRQKDFKKALGEAQTAIKINPKTEMGFISLADAYSGLGDMDNAIKAIEQAAANTQNVEHREKLLAHAEKMRLRASTIQPQTLWRAFDENEVAAEDAYKGKEITVAGKIATITTSPTGYPQVSFTIDKFGMHKVVCEFEKEERPTIAKLQKGQQVTLAGTCQGMMLKSVFLKQCRLIE